MSIAKVRTMTAEQVRHQLADLASAQGSQRALATRIGISPAYLCEIIGGTREPAGKVLEWLKLRREVRYVHTGRAG